MASPIWGRNEEIMTGRLTIRARAAKGFLLAAIVALAESHALSQGTQQIQDHVDAIKHAAALNKLALSEYRWREQQTIRIRGEVRQQQVFQVQQAPDGQLTKTPLSASPTAQNSGESRPREAVVEKATDEFERYAQQIVLLAQSYVQLDPQALLLAYRRGNVTLESQGIPGQFQLIVANYIRPNDSVSLVFSEAQRAIQSLRILSYIDDPQNIVTISAQFNRLPDGTNHVSNMLVNGVSKQLTVAIQNSDYQKM